VGPLSRSCGARPCGPGPLRCSLRGAAAMPLAPALDGPSHGGFSPVLRCAPDCPRCAALLGAADARQQPHPRPCLQRSLCSTAANTPRSTARGRQP